MQFGFTLKPDHSLERTIDLTRRAEAAGFDYGWLFDSHVLWREPYVLLTLMAEATERMRLGTCVTNPATREPSVTASALAVLDELSGGRMDLGIGRGDSARRVLGKPPTTMADPRGGDQGHPGLVEGRAVTYEGTELQLTWTGKWTLPVWVAGYGPMALAMTGRIADGVILQLADPDLIRWFVGQVREAEAVAAGRDAASIKVQAAAPLHIGPREAGRERTRWFPALVSQPRRGPRQQVPARAAPRVADRLRHRSHRLRLPPPRRGRLVERRLRRRRGDRPVLRARSVDGGHRQAPRPRRRRRRPVQRLPDEWRRGAASWSGSAATSFLRCASALRSRLQAPPNHQEVDVDKKAKNPVWRSRTAGQDKDREIAQVAFDPGAARTPCRDVNRLDRFRGRVGTIASRPGTEVILRVGHRTAARHAEIPSPGFPRSAARGAPMGASGPFVAVTRGGDERSRSPPAAPLPPPRFGDGRARLARCAPRRGRGLGDPALLVGDARST